MNRFATLFLLVMAGISLRPLSAELPPSVYEEKQKSAGEFVKIEVLRVEIEPGAEGEQIVSAMVLLSEVMRSASGLKAGDMVNVVYSIHDRPQGFVGPGEIPLIHERQSTIAYLTKNGEAPTYSPAAGAMSFSNF